MPFSTEAFFVLTRTKSRAKSVIAQKASVENGIFGSKPPGIVRKS